MSPPRSAWLILVLTFAVSIMFHVFFHVLSFANFRGCLMFGSEASASLVRPSHKNKLIISN